MKMILVALVTTLVLALAGCASSGGHPTACGKCDCKMMRPSAADPHKCAMCGHDASGHKQPAADGSGAAAHKH